MLSKDFFFEKMDIDNTDPNIPSTVLPSSAPIHKYLLTYIKVK
jgi:hypothetical protein